MALTISDRIKETSNTTGTGTYTLAGAVTGFETFTANLSNSDTTYYCCTDNTDFEVGLGTFTTSGTTLARTTILASSNSNNAVSWTSGTRTLFCTLPAAKTVFLDASGNTTIGGVVTIGSQLIMPDVTSAKILVADGTSYQEVAVSGDVTIANTGAVTIGSGVVETSMIAADAITAGLIGDNVINSEHYAAGSIDLEHMSANSVDSDQYVDGSIDLIHMSANSVDSDQYVDGSIDTAHIANLQITTGLIAADAITAAKIADDVVNSEHYAAGSIDTEHLADAQVTVAKMAANSVDSDQYVDGSIDTVHIADVQVTTAKIAADAITEAKIADAAVESEHLNNNVISGQTALTSGLALTDELFVSDAGTLKRMDVSVLTTLTDDNATALAIALG
jgi:hypothetical protein